MSDVTDTDTELEASDEALVEDETEAAEGTDEDTEAEPTDED